MYKEFKIPLYGDESPQRIILLVSNSEDDYNNKLKKLILKHNVKSDTTFYEWNDFVAYVQIIHTDDKKSHFVLSWKKGEKHVSTLVHETVHLVNYIFDSRGVKYDVNNDEVFTYYQEKIFNLFFKHLFNIPKPK